MVLDRRDKFRLGIEPLKWLCWPCAPFHPVIDPPRSGEKFGGTWLLGRPPDLAAKAKGDKRRVGKRERPEVAYGRDPRDPRDTVKAGLPAPQSPAMEAHIPRSASEAGPPGERAETADARTLRRVGGEERPRLRGRTGHLRHARTSMTEGKRDGLPGASPRATGVP